MKEMLLVFLGSGLGGCIRYGCSLVFRQTILGAGNFPWATFITNLLASALAGFIAGRLLNGQPNSDHFRLLLLTGFCGGFSTFSAWSLETVELFRNGMFSIAVLYLVLSIAGGLLLFWIFSRIV